MFPSGSPLFSNFIWRVAFIFTARNTQLIEDFFFKDLIKKNNFRFPNRKVLVKNKHQTPLKPAGGFLKD